MSHSRSNAQCASQLRHFRWLVAALFLAIGLTAAPAQSIDFGDDSGNWTNDGECDDPRFSGPGSAAVLEDADIRRDATDCQTLYEAGEVDYVAGDVSDPEDQPADPANDMNIGDVDFGDNTSLFANDQECDDPRFVGEFMAIELMEQDRGHDADDCQALFEEGRITLKPAPGEVVDAINFGDDTSRWSEDGECDDPRFDGPGSAIELVDENLGRDATDCRDLFLSGEVEFLGDDPAMDQVTSDGIDFGDNTSVWADDTECDDPRFAGSGMAQETSGGNLGHDANDCLGLYEAGDIHLVGAATLENNDASTAGIDFGDDGGEWPNDGECDDPRFEGPGMALAEYLDDANIGHDASDCRMHYVSGQVTVVGGSTGTSISMDGIDFGDDNGDWPNDGECDDMRFTGSGMAVIESLEEANIMHDATDCRTLFDAGEIEYIGARPGTPGNMGDIDFGDDSGTWPNDGECDDMRFQGSGMAAEEFLSGDNVARDATDCQDLFTRGLVELAPAEDEEYNGLYDGIDFGDDEGGWPRDGECDDPRFEGSGMAVASSLSDTNAAHDASDCMALYQSGDVQLIGGTSAPDNSAGFDFGDDNGDWPNDGECDDMRFTGSGMAAESTLTENNIGHDASDCRDGFLAGFVEIADGSSSAPEQPAGPDNSGIDFGDDSGNWPNDGECDDPRFEGPGMAFDDTLDNANISGDATDCRDLYNQGMVTLM